MTSKRGTAADENKRTILRIERQADHLDNVSWMIGEYMELEAVIRGSGVSRVALAESRNALAAAAHYLRKAAEAVVADVRRSIA